VGCWQAGEWGWCKGGGGHPPGGGGGRGRGRGRRGGGGWGGVGGGGGGGGGWGGGGAPYLVNSGGRRGEDCMGSAAYGAGFRGRRGWLGGWSALAGDAAIPPPGTVVLGRGCVHARARLEPFGGGGSRTGRWGGARGGVGKLRRSQHLAPGEAARSCSHGSGPRVGAAWEGGAVARGGSPS